MKYTRFSIPANFYFSVPGTGKVAEKNARAFLETIAEPGGDWGIEYKYPYDDDDSWDPWAITWLGDGSEGNAPDTVELSVEDEGDA